jgi:predicted protein tyrosine phosphatase
MILFICSQGRMRSRTAELLCLFGGLDARSAGTEADCVSPVNDALLREADEVFCMEAEHYDSIRDLCHFDSQSVTVLHIRDRYDRLESELVETLIRVMKQHRPAIGEDMRQGALLLAAQPGFYQSLGTYSCAPADNPAYRAMPSA